MFAIQNLLGQSVVLKKRKVTIFLALKNVRILLLSQSQPKMNALQKKHTGHASLVRFTFLAHVHHAAAISFFGCD